MDDFVYWDETAKFTDEQLNFLKNRLEKRKMETSPVAISALPVRLESMQWNGENEESVRKFIQPETSMKVKDGGLVLVWNDDSEEWQNAPIGYYVIKEETGNYFTCSPEAFERNYQVIK